MNAICSEFLPQFKDAEQIYSFMYTLGITTLRVHVKINKKTLKDFQIFMNHFSSRIKRQPVRSVIKLSMIYLGLFFNKELYGFWVIGRPIFSCKFYGLESVALKLFLKSENFDGLEKEILTVWKRKFLTV